MIISPLFLDDRNDRETEQAWIDRVMPVAAGRDFPVNGEDSWHGGIHIPHVDRDVHNIRLLRAIADGEVVYVRQPSSHYNQPPLRYFNQPTDNGCVVIKHQTEIGSGENATVTYYSLCLHMGTVLSTVVQGRRIYRKDPIGQVGHVGGVQAVHFQIFCDDNNLRNITGRSTAELDVSRDGRTDALYGDTHFYLPPGTPFYPRAPRGNVSDTGDLPLLHTSTAPLYITMTLANGHCTMVTRRQNGEIYEEVGEALVDVDRENDEYNLYNSAKSLYPQSPGAGLELLRWGRVINAEETLVPADAPLWRTVSFPGGRGMVNLAAAAIKKFSDADFPHWSGWRLVDDDADGNSQCNSPTLSAWRQQADFAERARKTICRFPLEWDASTLEARLAWLKDAQMYDPPLSEDDYARLQAHARALCIDVSGLPAGRVWHLEPRAFIAHFRKCAWLSPSEFKQVVPRNIIRQAGTRYHWDRVTLRESANSVFSRHAPALNRMFRKYGINTPLRLASFLGNAVQETSWLSVTREGYIYSATDERGQRYSYPIWYYPWYGRGFLQLTNPDNYYAYFTFRGRRFDSAVRDALVRDYARLQSDTGLRARERRSDSRILYDNQHPGLTQEVISWREAVESGDYDPADSAGFYWSMKGMAEFADKEHPLERQEVTTNDGLRVYYRSLAFWQASATVNLPGAVRRDDYRGLNGFIERCGAYASALAVLTEIKFPDARGGLTLEKPERTELRR